MALGRSDREVAGSASLAFSFLAIVMALGALVTSVQAISHDNDTRKALKKIEMNGSVSSSAAVRLQEYSISSHPSFVQSGKVTLSVTNAGTMTHEFVLIRSASAAALPKVTKPGGERAVGAIDEEAIAEADKMGETGDVKPGATATRIFDLTPGNYVMFCNIDIKEDSGTLNHFANGMVALLVVV